MCKHKMNHEVCGMCSGSGDCSSCTGSGDCDCLARVGETGDIEEQNQCAVCQGSGLCICCTDGDGLCSECGGVGHFPLDADPLVPE